MCEVCYRCTHLKITSTNPLLSVQRVLFWLSLTLWHNKTYDAGHPFCFPKECTYA
jgi:hypothetical protein